MSRPDFAYAQARIQARHGARPSEAEWHALEASRSAAQYLDRARAGGLARYSQRLTPDMGSHAIELELRNVRRNIMREVVGWLPPAWQPPVRWTGLLPDLPALAALIEGVAAPDWMSKDQLFGPLAQAEPQARSERLYAAGLGALVGTIMTSTGAGPNRGAQAMAEAWYRHWQQLLPPLSSSEARQMQRLVGLVAAHFGRLEQARAGESSTPHKQTLAAGLTALFRASGASPVAVHCHVALVGLDIERFRGGLLRRLLMPALPDKEVA